MQESNIDTETKTSKVNLLTNVYGNSVLTYNLFDCESLMEAVIQLESYNNSACHSLILDNQDYIYRNENNKYRNSLSIFNNVLKNE